MGLGFKVPSEFACLKVEQTLTARDVQGIIVKIDLNEILILTKQLRNDSITITIRIRIRSWRKSFVDY